MTFEFMLLITVMSIYSRELLHSSICSKEATTSASSRRLLRRLCGIDEYNYHYLAYGHLDGLNIYIYIYIYIYI
jgi:hypothetical protein